MALAAALLAALKAAVTAAIVPGQVVAVHVYVLQPLVQVAHLRQPYRELICATKPQAQMLTLPVIWYEALDQQPAAPW
jgi:hypothetical protein